MNYQYDVLIVGGGMVGSALGCALGGSGLRVGLLEERPPAPFDSSQPHDLRVSALSIASASVLKTVGAWRGVSTRRFCPYRRMRVWEERGEVEFRSEDINEPLLGYIAENRVIQWAVWDRLKNFQNIEVHCPIHISSIVHSTTLTTVELEEGHTLQTRLLVGADGGASRVRQTLGMGVSASDYEHEAFVLTVETGYGQQDITWQRFTPSGPQAFLPLNGPHASLVWYLPPEEVRRLERVDDISLLHELKETFPPNLGDVRAITAKGSFRLKRQHALHYVKEGVALIGDAAHTIHPLAGQGVNLGFLDVAALAQVLVDALRTGNDIGSLSVLHRYTDMRRHSNLIMMTMMDVFYRVFGNTSLPVKQFRNRGLQLAGRLKPAKAMVMQYAMGINKHMPKLARGEALIG